MPLAYSAPTTLPALVPETTSMRRPLASSILITPMWAKPFAAPPPRAMPMRTGFTGTGARGEQERERERDERGKGLAAEGHR